MFTDSDNLTFNKTITSANGGTPITNPLVFTDRDKWPMNVSNFTTALWHSYYTGIHIYLDVLCISICIIFKQMSSLVAGLRL